MAKCKCPHCGWSDHVEEELVGEIVNCPSCAAEFTVRKLKPRKSGVKLKTTKTRIKSPSGASTGKIRSNNQPGAKSTASFARQKTVAALPEEMEEFQPPKKKKSNKVKIAAFSCLGCLGILLVILGLIGAFLYYSYNTIEKKRLEKLTYLDAYKARLAEKTYSAQWKQDVVMLLAERNHYEAVGRSPRINSKKSMGKDISPDDYYREIHKLVGFDLQSLKTDPQLPITVENLKGFWFSYNLYKDGMYYHHLKDDEDYDTFALETKSSIEYLTPGSHIPYDGSWKLAGHSIEWKPDDINPILFFNKKYLVIQETDGSTTLFERLSPEDEQRLKDIGF